MGPYSIQNIGYTEYFQGKEINRGNVRLIKTVKMNDQVIIK